MPRPSLHAKPNILWRLWSEWEGEENPWRSSDATDQCWWACALKPMTAKPPWLLLLLLWGKAIDWKRERWWIERGRGGIYRGERLKRWWLCLVWPLGFTITFLVWTIGKNIKIRSSNHWLRLSGFSRTVSSLGLGRRCISPNPTFSYEVWTRLSLYSVLSTLMLLFFSVFITFSVVRPWKRPGFTTQSCGKFVMKR